MRFRTFLFIAIVASASAGLMYLIDDGLGMSWPQNVVRNWQQFGFLNLHGKLVYNPGGFEIAANPDVYKGMSPICLYPVYFATAIFSWTGLGTLSFHILLALVVMWAIWELLGRNHFALIIAAAAVLCPGYMRWQKMLDPNTLSVLPVIPYAAIAIIILKKPKLNAPLVALLFVLTLAFVSLNWTTAWVCGPCILLLLGVSGIKRRALILFIAMMVVSVLLVVAGSLMAKAGGGKTGIGPLSAAQLFAAYMWGDVGYGQGMKTGKAILRLAFVNGVGLFPLWLVFAYAVAVRIRRGARLSWLVFTPLALTIVEVGIMRNYFSHHPWMAGPVLLVGLVFSLALLRGSAAENTSETFPAGRVPAVALLCLIYGLAVLAFFRTNESDLLSLTGLVRAHTARSDIIVVVKNSDPGTARIAGRLGVPLDRRVVVVDDFKDLAAEKGHCVILSAVRLDDPFTLTAQSPGHSQSWLNKVTDWFRRSISRRQAGDRIELAGPYLLYEPKR